MSNHPEGIFTRMRELIVAHQANKDRVLKEMSALLRKSKTGRDQLMELGEVQLAIVYEHAIRTLRGRAISAVRARRSAAALGAQSLQTAAADRWDTYFLHRADGTNVALRLATPQEARAAADSRIKQADSLRASGRFLHLVADEAQARGANTIGEKLTPADLDRLARKADKS